LLDIEVLNAGLVRVHRIFLIALTAFGALMAAIGVLLLFSDRANAGIGLVGVFFLPLAALHWYAAKGARLGKSYGRTISRIIGFFRLFGFPIGTILRIYVFTKTAKRSRNANASDTGGGWLHTAD